MVRRTALRAAIAAAAYFTRIPPAEAAETASTYIGQVGPDFALIAWGDPNGRGRNTIGRNSIPMGEAVVRIDNRSIPASRNWLVVQGLSPDTSYNYEVDVNGLRIGGGRVRTWPETAARLAFFVIGDYGVGDSGQRAIAQIMWREFQRRAGSDNPVRFVLTVGDNIYASVRLGVLNFHSGEDDRDWKPKFFDPYRQLLQQIPFFPTLGDHDGNAQENRGDLAAYLDNFFFPGNRPARWYEFNYGGLVDFFALDSTANNESGDPKPVYTPGSEESQWLNRALEASRAPWKIPYFHHPPFNAGPRHGASFNTLRHWINHFYSSGVKVVFSGHEHNFQFSEDSDATGHIRYVVSGAGGQLRATSVLGNMSSARIEGWAPEHHFLLVEIDEKTMHITPLSDKRMRVRNPRGTEIRMPIVVNLP
ncbi:MAG TPA: metallophosphoesterase [Bryobacteraceae bacterium]|nr:metallophosphoesterase [Bryobacteraceae bacterium]